MKYKSILGIEIPSEFQSDLDLAKAYTSGVIRTREPARLESISELAEINNKFEGKTHGILVNARSSYEFSEGRHYVETARAYCAGLNIDRKMPGNFDPTKLEKTVKWSQIRGPIGSTLITYNGPDTFDIIQKINANPRFIADEYWGDEEKNPFSAKMRDYQCLKRGDAARAKMVIV